MDGASGVSGEKCAKEWVLHGFGGSGYTVMRWRKEGFSVVMLSSNKKNREEKREGCPLKFRKDEGKCCGCLPALFLAKNKMWQLFQTNIIEHLVLALRAVSERILFFR